MKKKIVAVTVALVLALGAPLALTGCFGGAPSEVKEIKSQNQKVGEVPFTNYTAYLNEDVDWENLSDSRKQAIINYTFAEARKKIEEDGVRNYNVIGALPATEERNTTPVFLWDREKDEVIIYSNNKERLGTLPVPK
ncbi:MAG: hypothetical protein FWG00_01990 [Coriobacteriia bacterium]|nr:hypothetical protein [Coriobacteriia bacterium]